MSIINDIQGTIISINLGDEVKHINISDLFDIDENDLTKEFAHQASLYAYFGNLAAEAEHDMGIADLNKDQEYAALDSSLRKQHDRRDEKYTEGSIRSEINTTESYITVLDEENEARYDYKVLKSIVAALEMRAQMLISIGSHVRHELDMTGMNIREHAFQNTVNSVKQTIRSKRGE